MQFLHGKLVQSEQCEQLYVAQGMQGTDTIAKNVNINPTDFEGLKSFVISHAIEMVVVGPEDH